MKKTLILITVLTLLVPQIAFAAWWNPFSWKVFSNIFNRQQVTSPQTLEIDEDAAIPKEESTIATPTSDTKKDVVDKKPPITNPVLDPLVQQKTKEPATPIPVPITATEKPSTDLKETELELIKQQNEILKQQLQAQQQIAQNTTVAPEPPPPAPLPTLNFSAKVEVGGINDKGFIYPKFASNDCLGCNITDISWFYVSLDKSVSSALITVKSKQTGQGPYNNTPLSNNPGSTQPLVAGEIVKLSGLAPENTYEYSIKATADGYTSSTISGEFTTPSARLVAVKDKSQYMFMTWGVSDNYSADVRLRSKVTLSSIQLRYYSPNDGNSGTWETKTNINEGDVIQLTNIRHSISAKDGDGNWMTDFSDKFDIISATATLSGKVIKFVY